MVEKRTWEEFRSSKLLWFVNQTLHLFGWAIVVDIDSNNNVTKAYPARVKFRGFDEKNNTEGYVKLTRHLKENIDDLIKEVNE